MAAAATTDPNPITTPMTYAQLQQQAAEQAATTIAGQVGPLQAQAKTLSGEETAARGDISKEFGTILPYVQSSAQTVGTAENNALSMEQQVFAAAGTRMNQLHQQMASEAQQLAQQMGGPVSTGQFTQALAPYESAMPGVAGAGMLNALGMAESGVQESQQFAGQVFPALQTEEQAKSDAFFNDQIKTLDNQITQYQAQKSDLVNTNLNTLLQQERQFQMDQTKLAMDKRVQQQQISASKTSQRLAQAAAKRAGVTLQLSADRVKQEQQRLQYEIQHGATQDQIAKARLRLQQATDAARIQHENQTARIGAARVSDSISKDAVTMIQAAMGSGKPVSRTYRVYDPSTKGKAGGILGGSHAGEYYDPKMKEWYKIAHETMTGEEWRQQTGEGPTPITDPNRLYDYMRGSLPQLGVKATINLIRAQTGQKNWSPGKQMTYTGNQLQAMPISELKGLARDVGYTGKLGPKANKQAIIDFLTHSMPHP